MIWNFGAGSESPIFQSSILMAKKLVSASVCKLSQSNHDHLGKLIAYASGLQAKTIIWIVEDVKDEHKQAISTALADSQ